MRSLTLACIIVSAAAHESELPAFLSEFAEKANEKLTHLGPYMRQVVKETINKRELPTLPDDAIPGNDTDACKACFEKASKFVIEHSLEKLKVMCEKASSCKAKKICGFMGDHPQMAIGMMIEHVRPMALAGAFCMGKGVCKPDAILSQDEVFEGKEAHEALMDHYDNLDLDGVTDEIEELAPRADDEEEEDEEQGELHEECQDEEHHHMHVCPRCMKHATRHIMGHAVMKVHEMCHASECPKAQRLCGWARDHREVAFGMLLMKVEPWKGAFGFCIGMKKGKAKGKGKHHHHHHGKGKGKGKSKGKGKGEGKGWMSHIFGEDAESVVV